MEEVAIFNASSSLYGAERGLLNLIKALRSKYSILVILPSKGPLIGKIKTVCPEADIMVFPLAVLRFSFSPFYLIKFIFLFFLDFFYFISWLKAKGIRTVVTNSMLLIHPALCAYILGKRHIWHIREVFSYKAANSLLGNYAISFSQRIICQSEFIKKALKLNSKAEVVYEPLDKKGYALFDKEEAREKLGLLQTGKVISVVSRIHPLKGQYEFLLRIKPLLKNENLLVVLAGEISLSNLRNRRYKRKIEKFIKRHNLANVLLLGFVENIGLLYSASDICVFPFLRPEPFGIAVCEALSFGRKTFYPFSGGLKEVRKMFGKGEEYNGDIAQKIEKLDCFEGNNALHIPDKLSFSVYKEAINKIYGN